MFTGKIGEVMGNYVVRRGEIRLAVDFRGEETPERAKSLLKKTGNDSIIFTNAFLRRQKIWL